MTSTDQPSIASEPWASWRATAELLAPLGIAGLRSRRVAADRMLDNEGAGHLLHGDGRDPSRPPAFDPLPLVMNPDSWGNLARGVEQRVHLAESTLADLYGTQSLLQAGVLEPEAVFGAPGYELACHGFTPLGGRFLTLYAADVVATPSGFRVVRELLDTPAGAALALLARTFSTRLLPGPLHQARTASIAPWFDQLRRALAGLAGTQSPRTVVLSGGPDSRLWFEHSWLASRLGFHLVEPADLTVRGGRLWLRSLGSLEPIDVVLRGISSADADPLELGSGDVGGVAGLTVAARTGAVALANAFGSGLTDGGWMEPHQSAVCEHLLGEMLLVPGANDRDRVHHAPLVFDEELSSDTATLRVFALATDAGVSVLPGGVAFVADTMKDVWVAAATLERPAPIFAQLPPALPQVDLRTSIPMRTAEALWWVGKNAERAEAVLRLAATVVRWIDERADDEPERLATGMAILRRQAGVVEPATEPIIGPKQMRAELSQSLSGYPTSATESLVQLVRNARASRGFLSAGAWRVIDALDADRSRLVADASKEELFVLGDIIEHALMALAGFSGFCAESMVRGPGWVFAELGRRIDRAVRVLDLVDATVLGAGDEATASYEIALAACDSLIAYRRLHRSDFTRAATLGLLVHDSSNPRSVAFQLQRIRELLQELPPHTRREEHDQLVVLAMSNALPVTDWSATQMILDVRAPLLDLAGEIVETWFTDEGAIRRIGGSR